MSSYLPVIAIDTALFPENYASGRQRWLADLTDNLHCFSYPCTGSGPDGEPLFTDTVPQHIGGLACVLGRNLTQLIENKR